MKRVRPHHEAEAELTDAIAWYEREREGLGREFWDEVQRTIALISENATIGGLVARARVSLPTRRLPLRRFPYFVIYRERPHDIQLVAIAHMNRRPGYWRARNS
jgi:toxin ParE1/3/4